MCIKPNIYLAYWSNAVVPCHSSGKASHVITEFNFVTDKTVKKDSVFQEAEIRLGLPSFQ